MEFVTPEELDALAAKAPATSPARHMVERAAHTIRDLEGRVQDLMAALQLARADIAAPSVVASVEPELMQPEPAHTMADASSIAELIAHPELRSAIVEAVRAEVATQLGTHANTHAAHVVHGHAEVAVPDAFVVLPETQPATPPMAHAAADDAHSPVLADLLEASFAMPSPAPAAPQVATQPERIVDLTSPNPFAFPEFATPPQQS